jgi:hypothetical protein
MNTVQKNIKWIIANETSRIACRNYFWACGLGEKAAKAETSAVCGTSATRLPTDGTWAECRDSSRSEV